MHVASRQLYYAYFYAKPSSKTLYHLHTIMEMSNFSSEDFSNAHTHIYIHAYKRKRTRANCLSLIHYETYSRPNQRPVQITD